MKIKKIVLTGGPCAGKTKILEFLTDELKKEGYYVIVVPETASEYIRNHVIPNDDREHTLMFQDIILCTQYIKERSSEIYAEFIKDKDNAVILYDRAIMDNRAYFSQEDYDNLLNKYDINEMETVDKYDLVIDLISTATLKQDSYELNDTRSEDIDKASLRDRLTSLAWLLHRNLRVIKPTDELKEKANIVLELIHDLLNNCQKTNDIVMEIDKDKTTLAEYNEDNSKRVKLSRIWLNNVMNEDLDYVLTQRQYNGYTSFTLDKMNSEELIDSSSITGSEYIQMISMYGIEKIENIEELIFIDNGNYFKIIDNDGHMYLQTDLQNIGFIPNNVVLKSNKCKSLSRKKNMI